jgi:hypothetical protein
MEMPVCWVMARWEWMAGVSGKRRAMARKAELVTQARSVVTKRAWRSWRAPEVAARWRVAP